LRAACSGGCLVGWSGPRRLSTAAARERFSALAPHLLAGDGQGQLDLRQELLGAGGAEGDHELPELALQLLLGALDGLLALLREERPRLLVRGGADVVDVRLGDHHPLVGGPFHDLARWHAAGQGANEGRLVALANRGLGGAGARGRLLGCTRSRLARFLGGALFRCHSLPRLPHTAGAYKGITITNDYYVGQFARGPALPAGFSLRSARDRLLAADAQGRCFAGSGRVHARS